MFAFFPRFLSSLDDNDDNDLDGLDDEDDELDDSEDEDDEDDDGEDDLAAFFLDCCFAAFFGAFFLFFLIFVTSVLVSVSAGRPSPSTALTFRLRRGLRRNPPSAALASLEAMQQGSVCRYIGSSQRPRRPRIVRSFGSTSSTMFPAHVAGLAAKRRGCGRARSA